jgi:3-dehydroquinate dehydratase-2
MAKILVVHGPNLNLLGTREPQHYGNATLADIDKNLKDAAKKAGADLTSKQSNAEHDLINEIQQAEKNKTDFIIINPAGFTHTSVALRDALAATGIPFIEIHLSNIYKREEFRHHSYFSDIAVGVISGLGAQGYQLALQAALSHINQPTN